MAGLNIFFFLMIAIFAGILNRGINCNIVESTKQENNAKKMLFVFGDSLFDPGNNQYIEPHSYWPSYSWPYGMSINNHSTGRFSDGYIVPDYIARFANLKMPPPYLKPGVDFSDGVSFASGGSGVLDIHPNVMNLGEQLEGLKKVVRLIGGRVGQAKVKAMMMRSVLLVSLGGNDYMKFNTNNHNATHSERTEYVHLIIGKLTDAFKEVYEMGIKKIAIQNVGPLGCYAMIKNMNNVTDGSCVERYLEHADEHNKALSKALHMLETHLPGFKYSILDYYHALNDRISHPSNYGFKVGEVACCGSGLYNGRYCGGGSSGTVEFHLCKDPNKYVLFDGGHHTQRTNQQLAQLFWSGHPTLTGPYNLNQLFQFP